MSETSGRPNRPLRPSQIIGIVGGLGPFAHIDFERKLLEAARECAGAVADQDYPAWILSSIPQTPDRTLALLGLAPSPVPALVESLRRLETHRDADGREVRGADFAVVLCITAHRFLPEAARQVRIPVLSLVDETAREIARTHPGARVGLLATTGTLRSGHFQAALRDRGLVPIVPLDLPEGEDLQREKVMEPIYGPWRDGRHVGGGIKTTGGRPKDVRDLQDAAARLVQAGAEVLIAGCTEIGLVLSGAEAGRPVIDPMQVAARLCVHRVYGLGVGEQ